MGFDRISIPHCWWIISLLVYSEAFGRIYRLKKRELRKRKHKYQLNRRTASKFVYSSMLTLLCSNRKKLLNTLMKIRDAILNFLSPIRSGRDFLRHFNYTIHSSCHSRACLSFWHWAKRLPYGSPTNFGRDVVFSADLCYNGANEKPFSGRKVAREAWRKEPA